MSEIKYTTSDNSLEINLKFITKRRLHRTSYGKSYPIHTQCLIFSNGILECFETIIKHDKDDDNTKFAYRLVAEKCIKNIKNKWLRGEIRTELNKFLETL